MSKLFLVISILVLSANSWGQGHLTCSVDQVEIPFHLFDGKIILPIKVDDKVVLNFALDTGVNQPILLDRSWAKTLGWTYHRNTHVMGVGSNRKMPAKVTYPQVKLELPGLIGKNITFLVLNQDPLGLNKYDIHGLIGAHLLMDPLVQIDYQRQLISFSNRKRLNIGLADYHVVDLTFKGLKPYVTAEINQEQLDLLMDLGSNHEVLLFGNTSKKNTFKFNGKGLGGPFSARGKTAQLFKIGELILKGVNLAFVNARSYAHKQSLQQRQGTFGSRLLRNYLLVLDYKHQKLYLKPNNSAEMNNLFPHIIAAQNHY